MALMHFPNVAVVEKCGCGPDSIYDKNGNLEDGSKLLEKEPAVEAIVRRYQTTLAEFDRTVLYERRYAMHNFAEE